MVVGIKDCFKLIGISIIAFCAVFVCTLFLNYNLDLIAIKDSISSESLPLYNALVSMGKVVCIVSGGCLIITSLIMLMYYVKNYIDIHGKELGIMKAIGYTNLQIAKHFWVFGASVLVGCVFGFIVAFAYMPTFYNQQNADLLIDMQVKFHPILVLSLIVAPTLLFLIVAVLYAYLKLKTPVLDLLKEKNEYKFKAGKREAKGSFLQSLRVETIRSKKVLVFFIVFSAFCFSAMTQMSMSMKELSSEQFAFMIITIGLILAFVTLILSLSSVIKANTKTVAMMRVFGYTDRECAHSVFSGYRPFAYLGFLIGTGYQYLLLKLIMTFIFDDISGIVEYHFGYIGFVISLIAFLIVYEMIFYVYSARLRKLSIKSIMSE